MNIVARVTAYLEKRLYKEGSEVSANDQLYLLERPPFEADLDAKRAQVAQLEATFILGLLPLVVASGAAQISRRAVGTAMFGGMIAASSIGIFLVPMLYATFQRVRERLKERIGRHADATNAPAPHADE